MTTIEERARILADGCEATNDEFGHGYRKGLYDGYVIGSNKQESIDEKATKKIVERAAMRFYEEVRQMVSIMNAAAPGSGDIIDIEKSVKHFIDKILNP